MTVILASKSAARRTMLSAAGVAYEAMAAGVDEEAAKIGFRTENLRPRDLADALAEIKSMRLSLRIPGGLVIGSDQVLALEDGTMFDKPESREQAREQLLILSGKTHSLWSAAVISENGQPIWRHVDRVKMTMRSLSEGFVESYLDMEYAHIEGCVGCYRIEGPGAQLFSRIEGSHFTILGMPLLPLLDYLRTRGYLQT